MEVERQDNLNPEIVEEQPQSKEPSETNQDYPTSDRNGENVRYKEAISDSNSHGYSKYATKAPMNKKYSHNEKTHTNERSSKEIEVLVLLPRQIVEKLRDDEEFELLKTKVQTFKFEYKSGEGEVLEGEKIISVYDQDNERKLQGAQTLIEEILEYNKTDLSGACISIYIPDEMVSFLIGQKGRQVNKIMAETGSKIIVSKGNRDFPKRKVNIFGKKRSIQCAVVSIVTIVQKMMMKSPNFEKKSRYFPDKNAKVKVKFVLNKSLASFIIKEKGYFLKGLKKEFTVNIKLYKETEIRCLNDNENILSVSGRLQEVQDTIVFIIRTIHEYTSQRETTDDKIKILIPNIYVTKLIGTKGSMVREIAARSSGAQIKILSSKESERRLQDCIVTIAGTLANKQDAVCIVLEELESFKQQDLERKENSYEGGYHKRQPYYKGDSYDSSRSPKRHKKSRKRSRSSNSSYSRSRSRGKERRRRSKSSRNTSFFDLEANKTKITNRIVVPDHLMKNFYKDQGELIQNIANWSHCKVIICKKDSEIITSENVPGRLINLIGTPEACSEAFLYLQKTIIKLEGKVKERRREHEYSYKQRPY